MNGDVKKGKEKGKFKVYMFVFTMAYLVMCDLFYTYSIVTYVADIVVDFGMTDDKRKAGFYVGLLISAFFFGLFFSSVGWALISNVIGRRKTLFISLFNVTFLTFLSMFTWNYYYLLVLRFLMGFLSGLLPVAKTSVGENRDIPCKYLGWCFSVINFGNCFGSIIAPLFSGFFSRPTKQYNLFKNIENPYLVVLKKVLDKFPLLIPNFISVIVLSIGLVSVYFFAYETNEKILGYESIEESGEENSEETVTSDSTPSSIIDSTSLTETEILISDESSASEPSSFTSSASSSETESEGDIETKTNYRLPATVIVMYSIMNIGVLVFVRTLPVQWSMLPEHKGLGLTNYEIGILGNFIGIAGCVSAVVLPFVMHFVNPVWIMRLLPLSMILLVPFYPELSYLIENDFRGLMWFIVICLTILRSFAITSMYTCIVLLMSNSVRNSQKGVLQGFANAIGGFGKGVGPVLGNWLLSIGSLVDVFPLDIHFTFFLAVGLFVVVTIIGFSVPTSLQYPVDSNIRDRRSKNDEENK